MVFAAAESPDPAVAGQRLVRLTILDATEIPGQIFNAMDARAVFSALRKLIDGAEDGKHRGDYDRTRCSCQRRTEGRWPE